MKVPYKYVFVLGIVLCAILYENINIIHIFMVRPLFLYIKYNVDNVFRCLLIMSFNHWMITWLGKANIMVGKEFNYEMNIIYIMYYCVYC